MRTLLVLLASLVLVGCHGKASSKADISKQLALMLPLERKAVGDWKIVVLPDPNHAPTVLDKMAESLSAHLELTADHKFEFVRSGFTGNLYHVRGNWTYRSQTITLRPETSDGETEEKLRKEYDSVSQHYPLHRIRPALVDTVERLRRCASPFAPSDFK
ncbi:MAG TPA: hypothetical protein VG820_02405 [Fimbriimonadaceae bacterium]|nr:hypothetical protein [Fimbriimonadaceae bacterium]